MEVAGCNPADPPSMMPDVLVEMTAADFFAGRDSVMDAALRETAPKQ